MEWWWCSCEDNRTTTHQRQSGGRNGDDPRPYPNVCDLWLIVSYGDLSDSWIIKSFSNLAHVVGWCHVRTNEVPTIALGKVKRVAYYPTLLVYLWLVSRDAGGRSVDVDVRQGVVWMLLCILFYFWCRSWLMMPCQQSTTILNKQHWVWCSCILSY